MESEIINAVEDLAIDTIQSDEDGIWNAYSDGKLIVFAGSLAELLQAIITEASK